MKPNHSSAVQALEQAVRRSKGDSPGNRAWRRFRRHRLALLGSIVITIMLIACYPLADLLGGWPRDGINLDAIGKPPGYLGHLLGTDMAGRDLWTRLLHGGRISLSVGIIATSIRMALAIFLGGIAGFYGGRIDNLIMRFTDAMMLFPTFVVLIMVVTYLKPSIYNVMIVLGILGWEGTARLIRGQILSLKNQDYVLAARTVGVPEMGILFTHLLPNTMSVLVVAATFGVAGGVLTEAGLSFLGLGVQLPTPSWGNMMNSAQTLNILEQHWWIWIFPGLATAISVLAINFIGDGLRDALDPRGMDR
ncbi:MAG: ABC transporter permease [Chloroflexi bacterium]|nr:ABC transporter permease [Chloroflexota bacterium]